MIPPGASHRHRPTLALTGAPLDGFVLLVRLLDRERDRPQPQPLQRVLAAPPARLAIPTALLAETVREEPPDAPGRDRVRQEAAFGEPNAGGAHGALQGNPGTKTLVVRWYSRSSSPRPATAWASV
ncbi:MAG: hypothetical protein HYZ53_15280 [Planctomycetes bacterium]|nr:hypothetical protein [Planctomycetota bacterium]